MALDNLDNVTHKCTLNSPSLTINDIYSPAKTTGLYVIPYLFRFCENNVLSLLRLSKPTLHE